MPRATARLLDTIGGDVFTLGDNAYPNGSRDNYRDCYRANVGPPRRPHASGAGQSRVHHAWRGTAYFEYFGENAGPAGLGYYSFDLGAWHIISLNSNAASRGPASDRRVRRRRCGCRRTWRRIRTKCTLAYWHHPLFSSGQNGDNPEMRDVLSASFTTRTPIVVADRPRSLYERFAPQSADGRMDLARGIREFIVGTGGMVDLYNFTTVKPNSEVRDNQHHGVLKLTLAADSYPWEFVTPNGVMDTGVPTACH